MVDGFRWGFFGASDVHPALCAAVVVGSSAALAVAALLLVRSGYKLRH
jgi:ABC-2 type transport system permease protein